MTPYSTVLVVSRRGIIRPILFITVALRLRGTVGTLIYVVALVPIVVLLDIRALRGILLIFGLVVLALMIDSSDRSRQARGPDNVAEKMGRAAVNRASA